MKTIIISVVILAVSFSTYAQRSSVADVPMLFYGTRPAIEVSVNGQGPYLFLVDTGAQGMARADTTLVKILGLAVVGQTAAEAQRKTAAIALGRKLVNTLFKKIAFNLRMRSN